MRISVFTTLVMIVTFSWSNLSGQTSGICGVTDGTPLLERTSAHLEAIAHGQVHPRSAVKYVPMTFILVADDNGNGRAREEQVLEQVASLNAMFAPQEIVYYIDEWRYKDHSGIYDDQSLSPAIFQMRLSEDPNAVNVFVVRTCFHGGSDLPPGAQINGYYSPGEDWLVMRRDKTNGFDYTLAHEAGHYWSLAHPHNGWECEPYDEELHGNPVNILFTPCISNLRIELANGSNCSTTGDRICDTKPDYNFGYGWSSGGDECAEYDIEVRDSNGDLLDVEERNVMGYFTNCDSYFFSPNQQAVIQSDYYSQQRSHIRTGYVPKTDTVTNEVTYNYPVGGEETPTFNDVELDWEDVPGATDYLVIIDRSPGFTFGPKRYIVQQSFLALDALTPNVNYYWRVWPFNESKTGAGWGATESFHTGTASAIETIRSVSRMEVYPNPVEDADEITLLIETDQPFEADITLYDGTGKLVARKPSEAVDVQRQNRIGISIEGLSAGLYFVKVRSSEGGVISKKISVL